MKKILSILLMVFLGSGIVYGQQYAIIKKSAFGAQKIELYKTMDEALNNYTGEGTVYEITLKEVPVKLVSKKKKVEVMEDEWIKDDKNGKKEKEKEKPK